MMHDIQQPTQNWWRQLPNGDVNDSTVSRAQMPCRDLGRKSPETKGLTKLRFFVVIERKFVGLIINVLLSYSFRVILETSTFTITPSSVILCDHFTVKEVGRACSHIGARGIDLVIDERYYFTHSPILCTRPSAIVPSPSTLQKSGTRFRRRSRHYRHWRHSSAH